MIARIVTALAAASVLACASAHAGARADATLTDLRVQLFSLGAGREATPDVTFQSGGGSMARVTDTTYSGGGSRTASASSGAVFAPVDATDAAGAAADGSARISGNAFKDGAEVATSARAGSAGSGSEASAYLGDGDNTTTFTLSAHSLIVISMMADLSAFAGPSPNDYAIGSAELEFLGVQGDNSQQSLANALASAGGAMGQSHSLHELLTVSFVNPYDYAIQGTFFGGIDATAAAAAPVPEPADAALMLAGLGLFGVAGSLRRRGARRARQQG